MNTNVAKISISNSDNNISYVVSCFVDKEKNILSYVEKDKEKTFVVFDYKNKILKRDNNMLYMEYDFNNEIGEILIKNLNKKMFISLNVKKLELSNEFIYIEYYSNDDLYKYEITYVK